MAFLCGIERLKIVKETDSPGGGGTPWNSWCGCAAQFLKP